MNPTIAESTNALSLKKLPFVEIVAFVAVLYFAKELLLPLALAILISFLLAPIVRLFERWHMGRVASVLATSAIAFSIIGGIGYIMAGQLLDLANGLPKYQKNLHAKIVSLKTSGDSPWNRATGTLRELSGDFAEVDQTAPASGGNAAKKSSDKPAFSLFLRGAGKPGNAAQDPGTKMEVFTRTGGLPVEVVHTSESALETLKNVAAPIIAPLGTAAVVVVLVIFILLDREDIRDRFIFLVGPGRLHITTQALDEAGQRVSSYILAQAIVNLSYGIPIGIGLYFIGIPNAVLWGLLAAVLRFVPYVGAWTAALFPLILSLAISPGWTQPLLTAGLFLVVELITNNVIEPWLYGSRTGLSTLAIILAAIFWTWIWGPVGLILATPLTVCISVLGRYLPNLAFFELILGDKPPISPSARFYQRLITLDADGVSTVCDDYSGKHSIASTFDTILVPALRQISTDRRTGSISESTSKEMYELVREVIDELAEHKPIEKPEGPSLSQEPEPEAILCLPASNEADELAGLMLADLLRRGGARCEFVTAKALTAEMVETAAKISPKILCVSCVPPASVLPAQFLCRRLRERLEGQTRIIAGIWGETSAEAVKRVERFKRAQADEVFESLGSAAREILLQAGFSATPAGLTEKAKDEAAAVAGT